MLRHFQGKGLRLGQAMGPSPMAIFVKKYIDTCKVGLGQVKPISGTSAVARTGYKGPSTGARIG